MWGAKTKRLQYLELRGLLVRIDRVVQVWAIVGGLLRQRLGQMCPACRAVTDRTLDEASEQIEMEFSQLGELGPEDYAQLDDEAQDGAGAGGENDA
jgi:hypothetical protein